MKPDRFAALAAAYGGDLERWPDANRDAARRHLAEAPDAMAILLRERELDVALAASSAVPPTADRRRQVVTTLHRHRAARESRGRWLSWFGMLGALGSGAATGVAAMSLIYLQLANAPNGETASPLYEQSSFGDLAPVDDSGVAGKGA